MVCNSISQFLGVIGFLEMGVGSVSISLYKPLAVKDDESISKIIVSGQKFFSRLATIFTCVCLYTNVYLSFFCKTGNGIFVYIYNDCNIKH